MSKVISEKFSRERIFSRIRSSKQTPVELPDVPLYSIPGDPVENFIARLEGFDGKAVRFGSRAQALAWLLENIDLKGRVVYSAISDFNGNLQPESVADPHAAHVIDVCVAQGLMGVGETGSVWVTDESLGGAACALFSTDLYLLLDSRKVVDGIHTAYSQLDIRKAAYGSFFTGPSATADIEAVHITGAQGEISLTVLLYDK